MKLFISGSKDMKRWGKDHELPEAVLFKLDQLMGNGDSILIGDARGTDACVQKYLHNKRYHNVTVYVAGAKSMTRNNIGSWEEKHVGIHGRTGYSMYIEKDFQMSQDADAGIAIWDGESKGTFINMVCLAAQGKMCSVYLLAESRWVEVRSLNDLKDYAGEPDVWEAELIKETLASCGFSKEMQSFLSCERRISGPDLIDTVCQAPISLHEKLMLLQRLGKFRNLKYEVYQEALRNAAQKEGWPALKKKIRALADWRANGIWTDLWDAQQEILFAEKTSISDADDERIWYLFEEWYDTDSFIEKSSGAGMFRNLEAAMDYAEKEEADSITGEGWYRAEVWDPADVGWKEKRYDYYIYDGKVCWFEKLYPKEQYYGNSYYKCESRQFTAGCLGLNLCTPYKTGDIVHIDCSPFGPPFYAMIIESRDQYEFYSPSIIFQVPYTDKWRLTPLKHKRFYKHAEINSYEPMLSPLYRIRKVRPNELTGEDEQLRHLGDILAGDEEKAKAVLEAWDRGKYGDKTYEEAVAVFELL